MRIPVFRFLTVCLCALPLLAGCVQADETPQAESAAAKQTVDKANAIQEQSGENVREGNAVLDGK